MANQRDLHNRIIAADDAYYNADWRRTDLLMSDSEYDALKEQLRAIDPTDSAITRVGATAPNGEWKKARHRMQMGSLDKVNTPEEMRGWIEKSIGPNEALCWSEKLDGGSIELVYDDSGTLIHAITRGGGDDEGEDILQNVIRMRGVKPHLNFSGSIRGEIMLHRSAHQQHFSDSANPRNAAVGTSRRLDGTGSEHLSVYCYQIGNQTKATHDIRAEWEHLSCLRQDLGLLTPEWGRIEGSIEEKSQAMLAVWERYQSTTRNDLDYEIDGLVCSVDDLGAQDALGETHQRPKGKIAWKFRNQMFRTVVTSEEWTCKKSGRISPTIHFKPIEILGSTVSCASGYNYAYIERLGLGIGAVVEVTKAGEIIPRIESVVTPPEMVFARPTNCPVCSDDLEYGEVYITCPNPYCSGKQAGIINGWIKNLGIMEWGEALIDKLLQHELIGDISDIYRLKESDLMVLEGFAEASSKRAITELWKVNPITLPLLFGSIGIPSCGRTIFGLAVDSGLDTIEKLYGATEERFAAIKGFGPTRAAAVWTGLRANKDLVERIMKNGVKVSTIAKASAGPLAGMRIAITGSTVRKRDDWKEAIAAAGATFKSSVGKDTTHLVIADPTSTSIKANSARAAGVKLISEEELSQMIGG